MIPIAKPTIGDEEKQAVLAVLESGNLAQGEVVQRFEQAFAEAVGAKHVIAVSSGTAALHLSLLGLGIGPGDEVITSPFSFIATANAIMFTGASPVFADIDPDTFNLNPEMVEHTITPRTKAIIPVHLFGQAADLGALREIAKARNLLLVEDACQSHLAEYEGETVGSSGTACFSFYPTKNMTTGEGGAIATDDDSLEVRLRLLRNHGQQERYFHKSLGYNMRMTDIHAAIGLAQVPKLAGFVERRRRNARFYDEQLEGVVIPKTRSNCRHVFNQYTVRIESGRDWIADQLRKAGVGVGIYYPIPIHRQPLYQELGYHIDLPEAERASQVVLSLPVHPGVSELDLATVVDKVNSLSKAGLTHR